MNVPFTLRGRSEHFANFRAADGRKVGVVERIGGACLAVQSRRGELFVPFRAVARVEGNAIYLDRPATEIPQDVWSTPPASSLEGDQLDTQP